MFPETSWGHPAAGARRQEWQPREMRNPDPFLSVKRRQPCPTSPMASWGSGKKARRRIPRSLAAEAPSQCQAGQPACGPFSKRMNWAGGALRSPPRGTVFLFMTVFLRLGGEGEEGLSCRLFIHSPINSSNLHLVRVSVPGTKESTGYSNERAQLCVSCPQGAAASWRRLKSDDYRAGQERRVRTKCSSLIIQSFSRSGAWRPDGARHRSRPVLAGRVAAARCGYLHSIKIRPNQKFSSSGAWPHFQCSVATHGE